MELNIIHNQECLTGLKLLPDECVDCIVTSPPYYSLRDYKMKNQIGLEKTPDLYCKKIVQVFRECRRVLKKEGTLWLNIGDSYAGSWGNYSPGLKTKDLIGIPWLIAFALRADGWYLRQDIIWNKPNPMPESVTDRCTKSHEYIFLLSKSKKYFYDHEAIMTPLKNESIARLAQEIELQKGSHRVPGKKNGAMKAVTGHKIGSKKYDLEKPENATKSGKEWIPTMAGGGSKIGDHNGYYDRHGELICGAFANKKSVWTVTTKPFKEAHFATFPEEIPLTCIKAGCPEGGIVLDPFIGAGTTAVVARKLNRNFIGFELNPDYIKIAEKRLYTELGMFL